MTNRQAKAICSAFANRQADPARLSKPDKLNNATINIMIRQLNQMPRRPEPDWDRADRFLDLLRKLYPEETIPTLDASFPVPPPPLPTVAPPIELKIKERLTILTDDPHYAAVEASRLAQDQRYLSQTPETIERRYKLYKALLDAEYEEPDIHLELAKYDIT